MIVCPHPHGLIRETPARAVDQLDAARPVSERLLQQHRPACREAGHNGLVVGTCGCDVTARVGVGGQFHRAVARRHRAAARKLGGLRVWADRGQFGIGAAGVIGEAAAMCPVARMPQCHAGRLTEHRPPAGDQGQNWARRMTIDSDSFAAPAALVGTPASSGPRAFPAVRPPPCCYRPADRLRCT
jgi:hypothetical protein